VAGTKTRGRNSVVECQLPKLNVVGSNPIARFSTATIFMDACPYSQRKFWLLPEPISTAGA
jgi:hypothetical protein